MMWSTCHGKKPVLAVLLGPERTTTSGGYQLKNDVQYTPDSQGSLTILYVPWQASAQHVDMGAGEQRTAEWHAERDKRLTASAFGNALGYVTSVCLCQF